MTNRRTLTHDPDGYPRRISGGFACFIVVLFAIGLAARAAPLLNDDGRLFSQFPNDDSYLMLTIARNIATGHGMSTSDGTIPTNGTQPLVTVVWAVCYAVAGGDKTVGLALVHITQLLLAACAALLIHWLGSDLLPPHLKRTASLAAAAWFASPAFIMHTQNSLETGATALMLLCSLWAYHRLFSDAGGDQTAAPDGVRFARSVVMGCVLGVAFLVRNDVCFLIASFCLLHWLHPPWTHRTKRLGESVLMGATSVAVASPWLVNNAVRFGHLMPISGISESHAAVFSQNLIRIPATLAELVLVIVPIPAALEEDPLIVGGSLLVAAIGAGIFTVMWSRCGRSARMLVSVTAAHALGLILFYGLYFGATHAVGRFLSPLSGPVSILSAAAATIAVGRIPPWRTLLPTGLAAVMVAATFVLNGAAYHSGTNHGHLQVVEWVRGNVDDQVWVGAVQSGTCGYFHDRTINLDGKVNPGALEAILAGQLATYIEHQTRIRYIVDWYGLPRWAERIGLTADFRLLVSDPDQNLCVLERTVRSDGDPGARPPFKRRQAN